MSLFRSGKKMIDKFKTTLKQRFPSPDDVFSENFKFVIMGEKEFPTHFGMYNIVKPGNVSNPRTCPPTIPTPPYCTSPDFTEQSPQHPEIKDRRQIEGMRQSCKLAKRILKIAGDLVQVGITTDQIDELVHNTTVANGAYPSPLLYNRFPKSVCTSVNNVACHGIPDDRPLEDGDIITVDVSVYLNGFHGDCAATFLVGNVDERGAALVRIAKALLMDTIDICKPGVHFHDIGHFLSYQAAERSVRIIPCGCGHGIGSYFHGPPVIYHTANNVPGVMEEGMTFTIEPLVSQGTYEAVVLEDDWTVVTEDNSRVAQFEHTILITETGAEILTL